MRNNTGELIDKLFSRLDVWRLLPAYQLERRADIFFAIYLDEIIKTKFGDTIDLIVPEFPVRVGDISEKVPELNSSFKIDYVIICESTRKVYLTELKTDSRSRRDKQDWYLSKAKENNIKKLVDGLIKIYCATSQKKKYNNLIDALTNHGWVKTGEKIPVSICKDYDVEIVYIQPQNPDNISNVISFNEIVTILSSNEDDLTNRFVKSLKDWTVNPND
ncbi:MAG TPA: hypothetical protein VHP32_00735 [Ignavibacteria bacterium]|nr:hypothetical protein [Ignavibacteria bacterium]